MEPLPMIVRHELFEHEPRVSLSEDYEMVQALVVFRQPLIRAPTGCRPWVDGHDQEGARTLARAHACTRGRSPRKHTRFRRAGKGMAVHVDVGTADICRDQAARRS